MKKILILLILLLSIPNLVKAGGNPDYLTFTSNQDGSTIGFENIADDATIQYNDGTGKGWKVASTSTSITLDNGKSVQFKGDYSNVTTSKTVYTQFKIEGNVSASGDVNTLIDGKGGDIELSSYNYRCMFMECAGLTDASGLKLPSKNLANSCYSGMFSGCTNLTTVPELPATTLADDCYNKMFYECSSLTTAPELPATTLANYCYYSMFSKCTGLTTAPKLEATTLADYCYGNLFSNCSGLTKAPELPATFGTTD